ncbi:MAG: metal ABC transporter permease [Andreesenia angusta]|nr:metal ABC transporter permease [Andreesenia angusta]
MSAHVQIQIIAILAAMACAIPGVFLILRKMAMICDSITHTILLGIVISFFIVQDLSSPLLVIGAALMGVLTVYLTELLNQTNLVSEDSAIGLIFPALFSIAIIMISKFASSVHLCIDSVFLGEIEFAPFDRLLLNGTDIGPKAMYLIGAIFIINLIFVLLFYKELKLVTFDKSEAFILGFAPVALHYALMTIVSITTVGVFQAVGSILVISFMIVPPATAYLLTNNLKRMIFYAILIGAINSAIGHYLAIRWDVSIAGMIATVTGIVFTIVFILSPNDGVITNIRRRKKQRLDFAKLSILFHVNRHMAKDDFVEECNINTLNEHFRMNKKFINDTITELEKESMLEIKNSIAYVTDKGRDFIEAYD